jgi:DOPA 4,5-dioxygenase
MPTESSTIKDYHVHVYFDRDTQPEAERVRDGLAERFNVELGRIHFKAVGPHPQWMYQVKFHPKQFGKLVPWLMLNHESLNVLVHPQTGDDVADHSDNALWLGRKLKLKLGFMKKMAAKKTRPGQGVIRRLRPLYRSRLTLHA